MGLCKTSNFSIFTFINANDLRFCTRSYSSCVYRMMSFQSPNIKVCKMMTSHFRILFSLYRMDEFVLLGVKQSQKLYHPTSGTRRRVGMSNEFYERFRSQLENPCPDKILIKFDRTIARRLNCASPKLKALAKLNRKSTKIFNLRSACVSSGHPLAWICFVLC